MNHLLSNLAQQLGGKQALSTGDQRSGGTPLMPASSGGGEGGGDPFFQTYVSILGANVGGGEDANSGSSGSANSGEAAKGGGKMLPGMALAAPVTLENAQEGKAPSNTENEESQSTVRESGKAAESSGETAESGEARKGGESSEGEKSTEAKEKESTQNAGGENESEGESAGNEKESAGKQSQRTEKQETSAENRPTLPSGGETGRSAESGRTNGTGGAEEGGEKSSTTSTTSTTATAEGSESGGETAKGSSSQASGKKESETSARPANASGRPTENGPSEAPRESRPSQVPEENGQKPSAEEKSNTAGEKKGADSGSRKTSGSETGSRQRSAAVAAQRSGGSAATAGQAASSSQSAPAGAAEGTQNGGRAATGTSGSGSESAEIANRASAGSSGNGSSAGSRGRNAPRGSGSTSGSAPTANTQPGNQGGTADPGRTYGGKTAPAAPRQGESPDQDGGKTQKRQPLEQAKGLGGERSSSGKQDQNSPNRSSGGNSPVRQSGPDGIPAGSRQDGKAMELDPSGSRSRSAEQQNPKESGFSGMATGTNAASRPEQQRAVGFQPLNRVTEAEREFSPAMKSTQGELNRSTLEMMDTEMSGEQEFGGSDDSERGEMRKLEALNTSQLRNSSSVRQKLSMHIARAVRQELAQSRGGSEAQWQHHRFVLDDGQSVNVSFRQAEGAIQLQLGSGSAEMNKLLQQHLGEIREHLRQELDVDVNLEFQDFEGKQFEGEQSERPGDLTGARTPVEGDSEGEASPSSAPQHVRYMGFNTNEWTA